jgi:hypothetical protein
MARELRSLAFVLSLGGIAVVALFGGAFTLVRALLEWDDSVTGDWPDSLLWQSLALGFVGLSAAVVAAALYLRWIIRLGRSLRRPHAHTERH